MDKTTQVIFFKNRIRLWLTGPKVSFKLFLLYSDIISADFIDVVFIDIILRLSFDFNLLRKECMELQAELSERHNKEKQQWQKKEVELQNLVSPLEPLPL